MDSFDLHTDLPTWQVIERCGSLDIMANKKQAQPEAPAAGTETGSVVRTLELYCGCLRRSKVLALVSGGLLGADGVANPYAILCCI